MLQEIEEITPTTKKLKINIPSDVIKAEIDSAYSKLRANARIPGFRPGKVPQAILEKKFSKNVEAQVIEKIIPEFYSKAIKEAKLEPVNYPHIEDKIELIPSQPLSFSATVEVKPDIGDLNYEGIVLTRKTFTVEEDEVDTALKSLQESRAVYSISEDAIREGDMAIINCEAFIDGQPKEEMSYKDYPFVLGSEVMPTEFSKGLLEKKKGESVEIKLNFESTHPNSIIAGKEVLFQVLITETKKKNTPPLDDEFAKGFDCSSIDELRKKMRENIENRKKSQINLEYKKELLNYFISKHDFDVPASMMERELESLVLEAKQNAMRKGGAIKSDEELRKEYESSARENVKGVIILEAIGNKEDIQVSEDEVKRAIDEIAVRNNLSPEEVKKLYMVREGSMDALKSRLFADKVLDCMLEKAVIK